MDLKISKHVRYFHRFLQVLPSHAGHYDSVRLVMCFFALSGLDILNALDSLSPEKKEDIREWVYHLLVLPKDSGDGKSVARWGFQGSSSVIMKPMNGGVGEDCSKEYVCSHVTATYTGLINLLILGDDLSRIDRKAVAAGVRACQQLDGSFCATLVGGESDMRFVYSAAAVCYIIQDWSGMDVNLASEYILRSLTYENAFAQGPGLESHGGHTFCAVASLYLMGTLQTMLSEKQLDGLRRWCLMRQQSGFQGRPNKPIDTCYSFWVGATLKILECFDFIDKEENKAFVLAAQDCVIGGFSKWINTATDLHHSYFALAGLSLMNESALLSVHPALNFSNRAVEHMKELHKLWESV